MTITSPRELAASMALAACQISALQTLAADLPLLSWHAWEGEDGFDLHAHVHSSYFDPHGQYVALSPEQEIDALRIWANALGSDLRLTKVSRNDKVETLRLETRTELESGAKLCITADPYYRRQADEPAPVAAAHAA